MARNIPSLFKITFGAFSQNITKTISLGGTRTLYSAEAINLDGYKKTRANIHQQFSLMSDKFREKMQVHVDETSRNMIFTEDLKNMAHLVTADPADLELLRKMMVKFNGQNKEMRFGSFIFGPVIMRSYYYLDQPDEAFAAFTNPELEGFFHQSISYQILMDLLYNHGKYDEVKQVFKMIPVQTGEYTMYPRHPVTLVLGACYKENTPESLQYATELWQELKERGQFPMRRASIFLATLALNQGRPDISVEVLFNMKQGTYITVRNLKVAALADLNRLDDVVAIMRMSLTSDNPSRIKHTYFPEVIEKVEQAISRADLSDNETIVHFIRQLRQNGHILDTKLDDLVCAEIAMIPKPAFNRNPNQYPNYDNSTNDNYRARPRMQYNNYQRPGLKGLL